MRFMFENWFMIIVTIVVIIFGLSILIDFLKKPSEIQKQALLEFLKYAVTVAEKELGSGTGQLKLAKVYGMAVAQFTWLSTIYPFESFKADVDIALEWMQQQLDTNKAIEKVIKGA